MIAGTPEGRQREGGWIGRGLVYSRYLPVRQRDAAERGPRPVNTMNTINGRNHRIAARTAAGNPEANR
jgi:hypothetical protein